MDPAAVKDSSRQMVFSVQAIMTRLESLRSRNPDWRVCDWDNCGYGPITGWSRIGSGGPAIYLSAGIHGDEPAGVMALLQILEDDGLGRWADWYVCPVLNPEGLAEGQRGHLEFPDLNRDYRLPKSQRIRSHVHWLRKQPAFSLSLLLHEDWEMDGFYVYELLQPGQPALANSLLEGAGCAGPIEGTRDIDGFQSQDGIIRPMLDKQLLERPDWPEALYLYTEHKSSNYTLETPSRLPMNQRVLMQKEALRVALDRYQSHHGL